MFREKSAIKLLAIVAVGVFLASAAHGQTTTLFQTSFESGLSGWAQTGLYQSADSTVGHSDTSSALLLKQEWGGGIQKDFTGNFAAGTVFDLDWWTLMPQPGTRSCKWFTAELYPTGHPEQQVNIYQYNAIPQWTEQSLRLTLPAATNSITAVYHTENGNGWGYLGGVWIDDVAVRTIRPPPPPPAINPVNPPAEMAKYQFIAGVKPSFTWTPLTVGYNIELQVPGWDGNLSLSNSVTYPASPWTPNLNGWQHTFTTNNVFLGSALASLAPWEWQPSIDVSAGVKGGIEAVLGVSAKDGDLNWKIGGTLSAGLSGFVEANAAFLKNLAVIGFLMPDHVTVDFPIVGITLADVSQDLPLGSGFDYGAFKRAVSAKYLIPESGLSGQVMIGTIPINFDNDEKKVTVGLNAEAIVYAKTSFSASLDVYFRRLDGNSTIDPVAQSLGSSWGQQAPLSQLSCVTSTTGSSSIDANGRLRMTTGSPVWIIDPVNVSFTSDTLLFDAQFDGNDLGTGLLSVYSFYSPNATADCHGRGSMRQA